MTTMKVRRVRVVGGSRGLCLGVVQALVAAGAQVSLLARDGRRLAELAAALPVATMQGDMVDAQRINHARASAQPALLILNGGATPHMAPLPEQTWEAFARNWDVDVKATVLWIRAVLAGRMWQGCLVVVTCTGAASAFRPCWRGSVHHCRRRTSAGTWSPCSQTRLCAAVLLGFVIHCQRVRAPMIASRVFAGGWPAWALAISATLYAPLYGTLFMAPHLLRAQGGTAFVAALKLLPWTPALCIVAPLAGLLAGRFGERAGAITGVPGQPSGLAHWRWGPAMAPATTHRWRPSCGGVACVGLHVDPQELLHAGICLHNEADDNGLGGYQSGLQGAG